MIRIIFASICSLLISNLAIAQVPLTEKKSITIVGSAEMEIIPDEIYFAIVLQEYLNKDKVKVAIDKLEKELQVSVNASGIAKENLQIENVFGQQWAYKKRKQHEFFASKLYIIKLSDPSKIDDILDKLDAQGIDQAYISRFSHSKIEQFRKDLKIQAIKNAKEKARYLLEAIGEQLGDPIEIQEGTISETPVYWDYKTSYNQGSNSSSGYRNDQYGNSINFKTIKLRFEITAEFKIK
ncbi:MAG TPA: SIMPL domain-containing protein [Cytophagaceae bacterium]|nr:SIMPL domain-containing protein [Cytophagaceae bacterium]